MMRRYSVYTVAAVAAAVAVLAIQTAAVSAPHGAYIGCFNISDSTKLVTKGHRMSDISGCAPACKKQQAAFTMIGTDSVCRCSGVVPDVALQLDGKECLPGSKGVAVFYMYNGAATALCRISNVAMSDIKPAYASNHVTISVDGTLRVELKKGVGSRLETTDSYLYGLYQIEAKVSGASGVISSFYTRSSKVYPNTKLKDFSEIDWEFCNGKPCSPNMMHANSFTKAQTNQEVKFPVSDYQPKLGSGILTDNTFISYGINWQSNFLAWYANGQLMHILRNGDWLQLPEWEGRIRKQFQSPDLAQHQVISMWTDDRDVAPEAKFGGHLDTSKAPFYSYFRQLHRVVCDRPMLADPAAAAAAMGPSWLYGKNNAESDDLLETALNAPVIQTNVSDTIDDADNTTSTGADDANLPEVFVPITVDPTTLNRDDSSLDSPVVIGPGWLPDLTVYPMNDLQLLTSSGLLSSNISLADVSMGPNAAGAFTAGVYHMLMAVFATVVLSGMVLA